MNSAWQMASTRTSPLTRNSLGAGFSPKEKCQTVSFLLSLSGYLQRDATIAKAMYEELGLREDADDFSFLEASRGELVTSSITLRKHV